MPTPPPLLHSCDPAVGCASCRLDQLLTPVHAVHLQEQSFDQTFDKMNKALQMRCTKCLIPLHHLTCLQEQSFDQTFDKMNKALQMSCIQGLPVRVVRSAKEKRSAYAPTEDEPVSRALVTHSLS